jgi:hypothetical protein
MTSAHEMLETYPGAFKLNERDLVEAIDALATCAKTCTACADACLAESDVASLVACIRTNLDCADICNATLRVLSRQTAYDAAVTRGQLEACVQVCRSCGDHCEEHADTGMKHCAVCAEACRRCERACAQLLDAIR